MDSRQTAQLHLHRSSRRPNPMTGSSPLLRAIAENRTPRSATPNPRTRVGRILRGFGYRHFSRRGFTGRADDAAQAAVCELPTRRVGKFSWRRRAVVTTRGIPTGANSRDLWRLPRQEPSIVRCWRRPQLRNGECPVIAMTAAATPSIRTTPSTRVEPTSF